MGTTIEESGVILDLCQYAKPIMQIANPHELHK